MIFQMTTVERLVVLLHDIRAERAEAVESYLILDDVESVLTGILRRESNVPSLAEIVNRLTPELESDVAVERLAAMLLEDLNG